MISKYPEETRFQLREGVVLVDVQEGLPEKETPEEIPYPFLIDNIFDPDKSKRVTLLTETTGFILRLISLGVDVKEHLPDIVRAEYEDSMDLEMAQEAVNKVLNLCEEFDYLVPRQKSTITTLAKDMSAFQTTVREFRKETVASIIGKTFFKFPFK